MEIEVKVPEVGESVQEAVLAQWYKRDGEFVRADEILFAIETDKVTLEVSAEADGVLKILVPEGETVSIGAVVGRIHTETKAAAAEEEAPREEEKRPARKEPERVEASKPEAAPSERPGHPRRPEREAAAEGERERLQPGLSPSVRRIVAEKGLDASKVSGTGPGGRITKGDVLEYLEAETGQRMPERTEEKPVELRQPPKPRVVGRPPEGDLKAAPPPQKEPPAVPEKPGVFQERTTRKPMSRIRQRIAERLLEARQNTAMLTTFNEIDMSGVQAARKRFKEVFQQKYEVSLGIMSFFIKASVAALKEFPEINAFIEGKEIIYHHYYHIGVAVGAERGLLVPVIRHADQLSFAEIEQTIVDYVQKIRENRIELADLEGGTFTITNGGVFGSLLSTPILNTPQSGILGMHRIEDRPVVVDGEVVIRPMMYVALSYDHRIVDGREAVTFLKRIKEYIENPERMMLEI